ncbi:MAG: hypothetical protein WAQ99_20615 [Pyrinomonadaceae bacterium]
MPIKTLFALCCFLLLSSSVAYACDKVRDREPGVRTSHWCTEEWIDFYWPAYHMSESDWDDGFGFDHACDRRRPLARTFQAIELLNYAGPDDATDVNDFSGDILHWGGNYTIREFANLKGRCGSDDIVAETLFGGFPWDNYTKLFIPFFYDEDVVTRAGTLIHEARHADGCGHNGNDGSNECIAESESCDEKYKEGCNDGTIRRGGVGIKILWLWAYAARADSQHSNSSMKVFAQDEANVRLNTFLDVDPCFNINSSGDKIITC